MKWKFARVRLVLGSLLVFALLFNVSSTAMAAPQQNEESGSHTFYDDEGKMNELVVVRTSEQVIAQLYIEGTLNQESIVERSTGNITGFKDFGNASIKTTVDHVIQNLDITDNSVSDNQNSSLKIASDSPKGSLIGGKYSEPWERFGYLYVDVTKKESAEYVFEFNKGTAITSIAASIVSFVIFSAIAPGTIVALIGGIVIGIVAGEIQSFFSGKFKTINTTENYEVWCNNKLGLRANKDFKYIWGYNQYTGAQEVKSDGQSGGVYWTNDDMLDFGIYNVMLMEL